MNRPWLGRTARWVWGVLAGLALLIVAAGAGLWWWAGQEGSLEWMLQRIARGQPLQTEGVTGSVRSGWRIQRLGWERAGLRIEAEDIRLDWQPLALLSRTLRVDNVTVAKVRVIDQRPEDDEPLELPASLRLPLRITVDEVAVGSVDYQGRTPVAASGIAGRYAFDGLRHRAELRSLKLAGGDYRGTASVLALPPMTLDTQLAGNFPTTVPGADTPVVLQFEARASGPVRDFEARAQLRVPQAGTAAADLPSATAAARITPFEKMPLPRGSADFRQLDLGQFWPTAPRTQLSGHVDVAPAGTATWTLSADLRNGLPGPWDANRLPVGSARAQGEWRDGTAMVRELQAQLAGGRIDGRGAWEGSGWNFIGRIEQVDPAQLHTSMAALPLSGPLKLAGEGEAIAFDVALRAGNGRVAPVRRPRGTQQDSVLAAVGSLELREAVAQGRWAGNALSLPSLRVRTSDALLEGNLELRLDGPSGSGRLQLRAPGLQGSADGAVAESSGKGSLALVSSDLGQAQQWLRRWPGVGDLLADLALRGRAEARLAWQGGWRDPSVQGRVQGSNLAWTPPPADGAGTPPAWLVRQADVQVNGRLRDATLALNAQAEQGQRMVRLAGAGRFGGTLGGAAPAWRGQLAQLDLQVLDPALAPAPWQLQLRRAFDWRYAGGNFEVSAGEALLRAPPPRGGATAASEAVVAWGPVRRQGGQLTTSGRIGGLPLAWIELLGGPQLAGSALSGDMVFDASWNAQLGSSVRVEATLARVRGDVMVLAESADGAAARVTAGVRDARLTLRSQGEQLTLALLWDSERAGRAEGEVRSRLVRTGDGGWRWPEQAPLAGRLRAELPRIGVWSLLAPPGWRLRGSLSADIAIAGTRAQPELSGPLLADDLALRSVVDGIELRNGRLRAQLAGQRLVVSEFVLRGGEEAGAGGGALVASGEGQWTAEGVVMQVSARLEQLRASIRSDRQLTVSGPLSARMDRTGTTIAGDLQVDRARIQIPDETAPRLGEDVVVRNAAGVAATEEERKLRPAPTDAGRTVTLTVSIDLGRDFRVSGRGVDTRLVGQVEVEGKSLAMPRMTGVVRTVGGTYEGYGQRMQIERGVLRFTGPPDNPALDVLAIRPNLTQRVGVQITGFAQSPHVELYSEGGLGEAETLSWLVLGRSSAGGGAETALLQRAATALLAGRRGTGKGLAGSLGLDDLTVGRGGENGPVVRLGKRFADNFYAAYERSLSGAMGTLYIFYDVSRRLTVRAEAGERTGVDLIFTFAFDKVRR